MIARLRNESGPNLAMRAHFHVNDCNCDYDVDDGRTVQLLWDPRCKENYDRMMGWDEK